MTELEAQIKEVARRRKIAAEDKAVVDCSRQYWEEEHKGIILLAQVSANVLAEAEAKLRELTLEAYTQTGNKHPAKGVNVKEFLTITYDDSEAFRWAQEHKMALKLDSTAFDKIVRAQITEDQNHQPVVPEGFDFVAAKKTPKPEIATDLSFALGEDR